MRSYQLNVRSRAGAIALGIAVVVLGIVVIVSGVALLIGVALIAAFITAGAIFLRKLFGKRTPPPVRRTRAQGFDPALEVFPPGVDEPLPRLGDPVRPGEDEGNAPTPRGSG
jgi:hypothetical protein